MILGIAGKVASHPPVGDLILAGILVVLGVGALAMAVRSRHRHRDDE